MTLRRQPRKGFAHQDDGSHAGFVDAIGHVLRPGPNTFGVFPFDWGTLGVGTGFGRVLGTHGLEGDQFGEYRMRVEMAWCYSLADLEAEVGQDAVARVIPAADIAIMRADEKILVETNLALAHDFETWFCAAGIYRVGEVRPAKEQYARTLIGNVGFLLSNHAHAQKPRGLRSYRRWAATESLTLCAHPDVLEKVEPSPDGVEPADSNDHKCHLLEHVPPSGGPWLPSANESLMVEASNHAIRVIEHGTGDDEVFSYVEGLVTAQPLACVEVLRFEELATTSPLTDAVRQLLAKAPGDRSYGWGKREFVPTDRRRHVQRRAIRRQLIIAKPSIIDILSSSMASTHLGTYECVLKQGALKATEAICEARTREIAARLLAPSRAASEGASQLRIMELVMEYALDRRHCIVPMVIKMPFPMVQMVSLSFFTSMLRDSTNRATLVKVFKNESVRSPYSQLAPSVHSSIPLIATDCH